MTGSIVGGAFGGLVLIAGMVLLFLVFLRRRRKRATAAAKKPAAELPTQPSAAQLNSHHGVSQLHGDSATFLDIESPEKSAA